MIPTHAVRVQTLLRAMVEVIIPALDPEAQLARDQAQILVGNLRLMIDQADRTYEYEMVELREYAQLLAELTAEAAGGPGVAAQRRLAETLLPGLQRIADVPIPSQSELAAEVRRAKSTVDGLIQAAYADGSPDFRRKAFDAVLTQQAGQNLRERAWFKAAGLDAEPDALPNLNEVLSLQCNETRR